MTFSISSNKKAQQNQELIMDSGISTTMRARKVIYDDYTHAFYVESRVEALERQCATRAKHTDVLNKSHDAHLRDQKKQVSLDSLSCYCVLTTIDNDLKKI